MARKLSAELILEIGKFRRGLKDAQASVGTFGRQGGSLGAKNLIGGLAGGILAAGQLITKSLVVTLTAAATIASRAAVKIITQAIAKAAELEVFGMRFEVLTGSRGASNKVLAELRADALRTGVAVKEMADNVGKFIAFGFSGDEALQLNKGILDIGGSVGLTGREMKLLGVALSQVAAKGVANMEELRQQIAEKGIPIFKALQQQLGVTGAELSKMIQEGKVGADVVLNLFSGAAKGEGPFGRFAGGAEKMASTFTGQTQVMKTHWDEFLRVLGGPVAESLKPLFEEVRVIIEGMTKHANKFGEYIGQAGDHLVGFARTLKGMSFGEVATVFKDAFLLAVKEIVNFLYRGLVTAIEMAGEKFRDIVSFDGGDVSGSAVDFASAMALEAERKMTSLVPAAMFGGQEGKDFALDKLQEKIDDLGGSIADRHELGMPSSVNLGSTMTEFAARMGRAANLFDTSGDKENLADFAGAMTLNTEFANIMRDSALAIKNFESKTKADVEIDTLANHNGDVASPSLNGALSQAVNVLSGRSANAVIATEAAKQTAEARKANKLLEDIAKNTKKEGKKGGLLPATAGAPRFD